MKKRDAVVISAYTGELCCDFKDVQKYVEGRLPEEKLRNKIMKTRILLSH